MRIVAVVVVVLCASLPSVAAGDPIETGRQSDCSELVPPALELDTSRHVDLRVRVLLDGVDRSVAERQLAAAQRPYSALNIGLVFDYATIATPASTDPPAYFAAARKALGGRRPPGIDLVYVLTDKDLGGTVAGQADCIGGIGWADRGFAVGRLETAEPNPTFGWFYDETAKVAAHELGHLLGGQHQQANCAEAPADDPDRNGCTLMSLDLGLMELKFGTLEAAVVRAHAERWAGQTPTTFYDPPKPREPAGSPPPEPPPARPPDPAPQPAPARSAPSGHDGARRETLACRTARLRARVRSAALRRANARALRRRRAVRLREAQRAVQRACRPARP